LIVCFFEFCLKREETRCPHRKPGQRKRGRNATRSREHCFQFQRSFVKRCHRVNSDVLDVAHLPGRKMHSSERHKKRRSSLCSFATHPFLVSDIFFMRLKFLFCQKVMGSSLLGEAGRTEYRLVSRRQRGSPVSNLTETVSDVQRPRCDSPLSLRRNTILTITALLLLFYALFTIKIANASSLCRTRKKRKDTKIQTQNTTMNAFR
jgi:hypothetical protein